MMAHTKRPLPTWFLAIHLISQAKAGLSALALRRQSAVTYPTACLPHHNIDRVMAARKSCHWLECAVQADDTYLGGEQVGGKPGRGFENKVPFVAAVSLSEKGWPRLLELKVVSGFTSDASGQWAKANLALGCAGVSDGLGCFAAVTAAGCIHQAVVGGDRQRRDLAQFLWVNTVLGNLKTTLAGAYHSLKHREYAALYLGAFAYQFNRSLDLRGLVSRLIVDVVRCTPIKEHVVRQHAQACF